MPYNVKQIKSKRHMKQFKMLSNAKDILAMREAIENNDQHVGKAFEIVHKGYAEMHTLRNLQVPKYKKSCSGCIHRINTMLKNWLGAYDSVEGDLDAPKSVSIGQAIKPKGNALVPIADRRKALEESSYNELTEAAKEAEVYDAAKTENGGKRPKKSQLIDKLLRV